MSAMRDALRDYLAMRRALGLKLVSDGTGLEIIRRLPGAGPSRLHLDRISTAWAQIPLLCSPARWAVQAGICSRLRTLLLGDRPAHRDPPR